MPNGRQPWLFLIAAMIPVIAPAQMLINPASKEGAAINEYFRKSVALKPKGGLKCQIADVPPRMGFDFRVWSGYRILLPARQFGGKASELAILFRVRPRKEPARESLFYSGRLGLPPLPGVKGHEFFYEGGFYLGPGDYDVDLMVADAEDRFCTRGWSVKANTGKVEGGLEANTVSGFGSNRWRGFLPTEGRAGRLTVLLHAAPVIRRRHATKLSPVDRMILLNSLVSLLSRSRYASARVIAFDLDGRRVVFEAEEFTAQSYRMLARTLDKVEFGTIDIQRLNTGRPDKLLADLLEREHKAKEQSEAIVFLGPAHRLAGKMLSEVRDVKLELPPTYYFTFSFLRISPDDWIDRVVKKLAKGKTIPIATPEDLSKAIARLEP